MVRLARKARDGIGVIGWLLDALQTCSPSSTCSGAPLGLRHPRHPKLRSRIRSHFRRYSEPSPAAHSPAQDVRAQITFPKPQTVAPIGDNALSASSTFWAPRVHNHNLGGSFQAWRANACTRCNAPPHKDCTSPSTVGFVQLVKRCSVERPKIDDTVKALFVPAVLKA